MENKLQNIKDEVAKIDNFHNWDDLFESCAMYDYGRLDKAINEIAIRYSQEQKRELVEMLKSILASEHLKGTIEESKVKQLITKHKQTERRS